MEYRNEWLTISWDAHNVGQWAYDKVNGIRFFYMGPLYIRVGRFTNLY